MRPSAAEYDSGYDSSYGTKYDTWAPWPKLTDPDRLLRTHLPNCPAHEVFLC